MQETTTTMKDAAKKSLITQGKQQNGTKTMKLSEYIATQKPGFALALPKDFDADRFTRIAITAIKNSEKLMKCEPASILGALMLCAQLGLEPNSPLHEASLIPYKGSAQFQIEYRGLLKLVWNSGMVSNVDYGIIYKNDQFKYVKGFNPIFEHVPLFNGDRGEPIAAYAIASIVGGGNAVSFWTLDEVKKHAARYSKAYGDGYKDSPWQTSFESMWIKTALKELCDKKLPKRTTNEALKFAKALSKDERINEISEETLLQAQARRLELDDIATEETDYEELPEKDKPAEPINEQPKELDPEFWEKEMKKIAPELIQKWADDHKNELTQFGDEWSAKYENIIYEKKLEIKSGKKK